MKVLKFIVATLAMLMLIFTTGGFFLPNYQKVSKSIVIQKNDSIVYSMIDEFANWEQWHSWKLNVDSNIVYTYSGSQKGNGSQRIWNNKTIGNGVATMHDCIKHNQILVTTEIENAKKIESKILVSALNESSCTVAWTDSMYIGWNPYLRYIGKALGRFLEEDIKNNLQNLKTYSEK